MKHTLMAIAVLGLAVAAQAEMILPIADVVKVTGTNWTIDAGFDAQADVAWDDVAKLPSGGVDGNSVGTYGGGIGGWHYGVIDFGDDYSLIEITRTFTLYNSWNPVTPTAVAEMWWTDATPDYFYDPGADVNRGTHQETELALNAAPASFPCRNGAWHEDFADTASPVTPEYRYLVLKLGDGGAAGNEEYLFVGNIVPEPVTLALLGIGGLAAGLRRRR